MTAPETHAVTATYTQDDIERLGVPEVVRNVTESIANDMLTRIINAPFRVVFRTDPNGPFLTPRQEAGVMLERLLLEQMTRAEAKTKRENGEKVARGIK